MKNHHLPAVEPPNPKVRHPHAHLSRDLSGPITAWFGSPKLFWILAASQIIWMALASLGFWIFKFDKYPFPFLLLCGSIFQLLSMPILGWITNVADEKRSAKADADHEALTHIANQVDAIAAAVLSSASSSNDEIPFTPGTDQLKG